MRKIINQYNQNIRLRDLKNVKGQINQNFDIFSFNPIYLVCVDLVSNKHILKFQVNWTQDRRDNGT